MQNEKSIESTKNKLEKQLKKLCTNKNYLKKNKKGKWKFNKCRCNENSKGKFCNKCNTGYLGDQCQYSNLETCNNNGNAQSDGSCVCNTGYLGDQCQYSNLETCNNNEMHKVMDHVFVKKDMQEMKSIFKLETCNNNGNA